MENKSYRDLMIVLMIRVYLLLALRCRERSWLYTTIIYAQITDVFAN